MVVAAFGTPQKGGNNQPTSVEDNNLYFHRYEYMPRRTFSVLHNLLMDAIRQVYPLKRTNLDHDLWRLHIHTVYMMANWINFDPVRRVNLNISDYPCFFFLKPNACLCVKILMPMFCVCECLCIVVVVGVIIPFLVLLLLLLFFQLLLPKMGGYLTRKDHIHHGRLEMFMHEVKTVTCRCHILYGDRECAPLMMTYCTWGTTRKVPKKRPFLAN